jgi:hypothetical protein
VFVNGKGEQDGADEEEEEEEENPLFWEDVPIEEWTPDLVAQCGSCLSCTYDINTCLFCDSQCDSVTV